MASLLKSLYNGEGGEETSYEVPIVALLDMDTMLLLVCEGQYAKRFAACTRRA